MPNISIIKKVNQQVTAIDYLLSKYTLLLVKQFVERQNFLIDEDISRMRLLGSSKEYALIVFELYTDFLNWLDR